ncbi:MAG TPA: orotate phosphoribosyltransferase [Gemmataceae bacterium]|jgi:orotate phosphoribosyltransferase
MSAIEKQLFQLLQDRSFKRGTFRLASGAMSEYYIDGKMAEAFSESAYLIGEVLYERTKDLSIDAIGGLEIGAVPLTTAAVISYHLHGQKMEGFWVRDKAKLHGTRKVIEGNLRPSSSVVILDDVITTGGSSGKAIKEVREMGCEVVRVLALVDRLQGAAEFFKNEGIADYQAIFTIRDFGIEV